MKRKYLSRRCLLPAVETGTVAADASKAIAFMGKPAEKLVISPGIVSRALQIGKQDLF